MAYPYSGQLNQNIITGSLFNMIISQRVFDINVATPKLADKFRVDGTLFGDTKLYHSFDIGAPFTWADVDNNLSPDRLAPNLLSLNRNKSAVTQSIKMGVYKYISITIDQYLSKQAFRDEGTFGEMIGVLSGSLRQIKKVYDNALINFSVGTYISTAPACNITIVPTLVSGDPEAQARMTAQRIAKELAVLKANLEDNSRDFNELGYLRSYDPSSLMAVWNVEQHATITKLDLPTIFHQEGLAGTGLEEIDIPSRWFGTLNNTPTIKGPTIRCSKSGWYNVSAVTAVIVNDYILASDVDKVKCIYLNEGDLMPNTGTYKDAVRGINVNVLSTTFPANSSYTVDPSILFILVDKESLPFMSGFETGTEFWNSLSLTTNHYLIYGHNKLEYLKEKPFIKVKLGTPAA